MAAGAWTYQTFPEGSFKLHLLVSQQSRVEAGVEANKGATRMVAAVLYGAYDFALVHS